MAGIVTLKSKDGAAGRRVRVLDAYAEMTGRDRGLTGRFMRWETLHPDIGIVDIGETRPVRLHRELFVFTP